MSRDVTRYVISGAMNALILLLTDNESMYWNISLIGETILREVDFLLKSENYIMKIFKLLSILEYYSG